MNNFFLYVIIFISPFLCTLCFDHYTWGRKKKTTLATSLDVSTENDSNVGKPLLLTPYIEQGQIEQAKTLSRVLPMVKDWPSYSGYFTVNKACGSNLFFWFIPAKKNYQTAPLLLWLQGGPGAGSLFGLFEEIGPFNHFPDGLMSRNYTWNKDNNVIYIDQPVGSGYSFSEKSCFAENMTVVTQELYSALIQFFQMFPELLKNRFFITGESFAGHYIPALAIHVHNNNPKSAVKINLAGTVIGNPLTKLSCHNYASLLYEWGVVDDIIRDEINSHHEMLKNHADANQFREAWEEWDYILNEIIGKKTNLPSRESIIAQPPDKSDYMTWVTTPNVRRTIHVGNIEYNDINFDVYNKLVNTIAEPMTKEIEQLLETKKYSVGFYSGNLDMICLYTSTECMLKGLQWWGGKEYLKAERHTWYFNDTLVGWLKLAGPLYELLIRDAGHSVPYYKPEVMYQLIQAVVTADPSVNPASTLNTSPPQ